MDVSAHSNAELSRALSGHLEGTLVVRTPASRGFEAAVVEALEAHHAAGKTVCIVCADTASKKNFTDALATAGLDAGTALTVEENAFDVLHDASVQQACGRTDRVLDGNEIDVLLEDVKVTGIKPKRLREMLKFFFNSIANCTAGEPDWIISDEEQRVYSVLMENLESRRAAMPCELAALACKGLEADRGTAARFGADVVVADGYDLMSATSQKLVSLLAGSTLIALGTGREVTSAEEPYPNREGLEQLAERADQIIKVEEARGAAPATVRTGKVPDKEIELAAEAVAALVEAGEAPEGILIGVANKVWADKIASALDGRKVPFTIDFGRGKLKGDPRVQEKCGAIAARAFFRLWLDGKDMSALRTWIGLGDWLLCSEAFLEVLAWAKEHGMNAFDALNALHAQPEQAAELMLFSKIDQRMSAYDELRAVYAQGDKAAIGQALAACGMQCAPQAVELLESCGDKLDAAELAAVARAGLTGSFDVPEEHDGAKAVVTITPYRRIIGRRAEHLFLTGMVNGFMPTLRSVDDRYSIDERAKSLKAETAVFDYLRALPTKSLELSLFEQDLLENAGMLKMETTRIFMKNGARRAHIAPSLFIEQLENAQ